jgi:predicted RNA-binding protein with RPS1 domain
MMILCDVEYWNYQKELREFREKCTPGNVVECDVIEVSGSSAVIKVGRYLRGYIKKEQIGWNVINKVSDVLYVGEPIHAVFIGEDNGELQFSLKYLQKEPYERALYDLSTDDLLSFLGHTGKRFIGKCRKRGQYYFFENLYSQNPGEIGRLLTDKIYGYNLKAVIVKHSASIIEDQFYAFDVELLNKEVRLERNQLFQFQATNIVPYKENPFSQDVLRSFKKNISPATNITASHLLAEIGKNMYSSKERMFFEWIQNADDAASENGVTVIVRTEGEYLTFAHNGFSFDKSDFEAITSANSLERARLKIPTPK